MKSLKKAQKGFTLIELLIVVAIIGILAAIAFPVYSDYTARAQASEGLTATSGLQADIGVDSYEAGMLSVSPATSTSAGNIKGKYISSVSVPAGSGSATITVNYNTVGAVKGSMTITPQWDTTAQQIYQWQCSAAAPMKDQWVPSGCR